MIYKKDIERLVLLMVKDIKKVAPIRTGNLRDSIRLEEVEPFKWVIYVNAGDDAFLRPTYFTSKKKKPVYTISGENLRGIAPYMPFTNEPWISPKWNGRRNPNQGWWQKACAIAMTNLQMRLNGTLEKGRSK